jgi:hypothetical protein
VAPASSGATSPAATPSARPADSSHALTDRK